MEPIYSVAKSFVNHLCGDSLTTFQCFYDPNSKDPDHRPFVLHGSFDERWTRLKNANLDGYGIYLNVNLTDGKGRQAENITGLRALFIDKDDGNLPPLALQPNIITTSKNGQHAYWFLDENQPLDRFTDAQARLIRKFKTDPKVKDLPRVMRIPGFLHCKELDDPFMVTYQHFSDDKHTIDEVLNQLNADPLPVVATVPRAEAPTISNHTIAVKRFEAYLIKAGPSIQGQHGDDHAHMLAKRAGDFGLSSSETFDLMRGWNVHNQPPFTDSDLNVIVENAFKYRRNDVGSDPPKPRSAPPPILAATKTQLTGGDMRFVAEHIEAFPDDEIDLIKAAKDVNKVNDLKKARKELARDRIAEDTPNGYVLDDRGVTYMQATEEGVKEVLVTPTRITLARRYRFIETGEEYLAVAWPGGERILLKSVLFDSSKVIKLASYGPSVTSINARLVVQYLQACDDAARDTLPCVTVVDKLGDHGAHGWVFGNECVGGNGGTVEYWPDRQSPGTATLSVGVSGSWEMQREILTGLETHPRALLCFYAACTSPLLSRVGVPGFVVDIHGKTSQGKTTAMRIAASIWGCPTGLLQKWNTTETYRERWAAFHNHIPIFLDDHKDRGSALRYTADGEHPITSAIYQLADGIGRGRGTITGIQSSRHWHSVIFSTGESSLLDYDNSEGSLVRCMSIDGKITDGASDEWMHRLTQLERHYGHVGRAIVALRTDYTDEIAKLIKLYSTELAKRGVSFAVGDRVARRLAAIMLAAKHVHAAIDLPWSFDPQSLDESLFATIGAVKNADRTDEAIRAIYDYAIAHRTRFVGHPDHRADGPATLGIWLDHSDLCGTIYFLSTAFASICNQLGYHRSSVLRDFKKRNWIDLTQSDIEQGRYSTQIRIDGITARGIGIRFGTAGLTRDLVLV